MEIASDITNTQVALGKVSSETKHFTPKSLIPNYYY